MRNLIVLLVAIYLVSCNNENTSTNDNIFLNCENMLDDGIYFTSCEEVLDISGLKMYPFLPFTDEEWRETDYSYKLERRQIPEEFLHSMTTKELFYQFVFTDLSGSMGVFNTRQQGFEAVTQQLNMLPELLNRPDAGHVLLELLQKVDLSKIQLDMSREMDCYWWYYCLQIIGAQMEVINRMTNEDICAYIHHQLRCHDIMQSSNDYPENAALLLYGLGNVMIRYKFEPFLQTLSRHPITNELIWDTQFIKKQYALQVIDFVKQFKKD